MKLSKLLIPALILAILLIVPSAISSANAKSTVSKPPVVDKETTYITSFNFVHGKYVGKFDYIQWFTGKAADRAFLQDCKCSKVMDHAPDGYWIRNINPKLRTFTVSNSAQYVLQTYDPYQIKWNQKVTRSQFIAFLKERNRDHHLPFHIEIKNGVVTKITEQYIP